METPSNVIAQMTSGDDDEANMEICLQPEEQITELNFHREEQPRRLEPSTEDILEYETEDDWRYAQEQE